MTRFKSNDDVAAVVIMPAFHEVAAALERVFAQRPVQEVVAIDGSTDNTRAALQSVAACDSHLKTLARAESGQWRTRGTGLSKFSAPYVVI
jgi:glycosyltransferase involved in cell wall biosynthesis